MSGFYILVPNIMIVEVNQNFLQRIATIGFHRGLKKGADKKIENDKHLTFGLSPLFCSLPLMQFIRYRSLKN